MTITQISALAHLHSDEVVSILLYSANGVKRASRLNEFTPSLSGVHVAQYSVVLRSVL
jgi:hypothetical protein